MYVLCIMLKGHLSGVVYCSWKNIENMEEIVIKDNDNGNGERKRLRQLSPHASPRSKNSFVTSSASF